jgi:hypothetical protein
MPGMALPHRTVSIRMHRSSFASIALCLLVLATLFQRAHATDLPLTAAEKAEVATAASTLRRNCIAGMGGGKRPSSDAKDYASRVGLLMFELQPPEPFCSCVATGVAKVPAAIYRSGNDADVNRHVADVSNSCMASFWRRGFKSFCNGLREEMIVAYGDRLGKFDRPKSEGICACSSKALEAMPDQQFKQFFARSADEVSSLYTSLNKKIVASNDSLSGLFASCGAGRMADAFGIQAR